MKKLFLVLVMLFSLNLYAVSFNDVFLGNPIVSGNCANAGVQTLINPDRQTVSILFNDWTASTDIWNGVYYKRAKCTVRLPVHVPNGIQVSLITYDYRGYAYVPSAKAILQTKYFWAGRFGKSVRRTLRANYDRDFTFRDTLGIGSIVWSRCGGTATLGSNSSAKAYASRNADEDTEIGVDSLDIHRVSQYIFKFQWRYCP